MEMNELRALSLAVVAGMACASAFRGNPPASCGSIAGDIEAEGFRMVKDGVLLWKVGATEDGSEMTFFVGKKPAIHIVAKEKHLVIALDHPSGDTFQHVIVKADTVGHTLGADENKSMVGSTIDKRVGHFRPQRVLMTQGAEISERVCEKTGSSTLVRAGRSEVMLDVGSEKITQRVRTGTGLELSADAADGVFKVDLLPGNKQRKKWSTSDGK